MKKEAKERDDLPNYKALIRYFEDAPRPVREHFPKLKQLLELQLLDVALAYVFLRIENAWHRALYGGLVRLHRAESKFANRIMELQHFTRGGFQDRFLAVYGKAPAGSEDIEKAESIRDRVIHGKPVATSDLRHAIAEAIDHATALSAQIRDIANFTPFGDMRGFSGKLKPLDRRTTKWVMKGMGFTIS